MATSLQNICGVPGLVVISNHPHVKNQIFSLISSSPNCYLLTDTEYEEWSDELQRSLSEILNDFNPVLKSVIPRHRLPFIAIEMLKWANCLKASFDLPLKFSQDFIKSSFFSSKGVLDEEKAARELVKEPSLSTFLKYNIACHYFLEDIVPDLWQILQNSKTNFKRELKTYKNKSPIVMWSNYLEKINSSNTALNRQFKVEVFNFGITWSNLAAFKFSFGPKREMRENETEVNEVRKLVEFSFCDYILDVMNNFKVERCQIYHLLFEDLVFDINLVEYFVSVTKKNKLKEFLVNSNSSYTFLKCLLFSPYQAQFMNVAHLLIDSLSEVDYHKVFKEIYYYLEIEYAHPFYNYRQLIREFWNKSPPHLKRSIINFESGEESVTRLHPHAFLLVENLFCLEDFTPYDMENICLILKDVNSNEKENIFRLKGERMCRELIFLYRNFKLADFFLESMDLNRETLETFKKEFIIECFYPIIMEMNLNFVEEFFKWVARSDEIDELKDEIFHRLTHSDKITYFFLQWVGESEISFVNNILKWFLKSDDKIDEWIKNVDYSPLLRIRTLEWLDKLLELLGYSKEKTSNFKKDLLFRTLPEIAKLFWNFTNDNENLESNVLYLSLYKKERIIEFIDALRTFYEDSIKQKICLICKNNNFVSNNEDESQIYCEKHVVNGFAYFYDVEVRCLSLQEKLMNCLAQHEMELKQQ